MRHTLFLLCFLTLVAKAQEASGWQSYSDMRSLTSGVFTGNDAWCTGSGGVFTYNLSSKVFKKLTKVDGLNGSPISASTAVKGSVWFGSENGTIDVYNPETGTIRSIRDITNSGRSKKKILSFETVGDTVYVASEFGVSLVNATTGAFYDTYLKFGSIPAASAVNAVFKQERIYLALDGGIAISKPSATNLISPDSWISYTVNEALPTSKITKVFPYKGNLLAGSDRGLLIGPAGGWNQFHPALGGKMIQDVTVNEDTIRVITQETSGSNVTSSVYVLINGTITDSLKGLPAISRMIRVTGREFYTASADGLMHFTLDGLLEAFVPNGPGSNLFLDLSVAGDGSLWVATGNDRSGRGFYNLKDGVWRNYTTITAPQLPTNAYFNVNALQDNTLFTGSWGRGFVRLKDSVFSVFTASNTPMVGIQSAPEFLVISSVQRDKDNNIWSLNFDPGNRKPLAVLTKDSVWHLFDNNVDLSATSYTRMVIDNYNTKWYYAQSRKGLFYLNEKGTFTSTADDAAGYVSESNGLNGELLTSLIIDQRGDIWTGASIGAFIMTNNYEAQNGNSSKVRFTLIYPLRQQTINDLAVDPINRKWAATNQGLFLVSADGTELLAAYNSSNSPLLSDKVISVAVDQNTGTVYAGTESGLVSFNTNAVKPVESFDELFFYPSPYMVTGSQAPVTIDGLVKDSKLKILSVDGRLIREITTPGGRVGYWDGRDESGTLVSTGIYIMVAFDTQGDKVAVGKIAVVRK